MTYTELFGIDSNMHLFLVTEKTHKINRSWLTTIKNIFVLRDRFSPLLTISDL